MSDNTEYWKELFGDDYNEDFMESLRRPSPPDAQDSRDLKSVYSDNATMDEPDDDGDRFYNYSVTGSDTPARNNTGGTKNSAVDKRQPSKDQADDFSVDFDFDGEYRDVPDNKPLRQRREKKTGCLGGILYAVFIICVCLLLASLMWLAATDVLGLGNDDEKVQVTVPEEFTIDNVADVLLDGGLIKYKFLFKLYADFSDAEEKITAGTYELNKIYDYRALVYGMNIGSGKRAEVDVTIPEGFTLRQIFELFAANNVCTEEELWDAAANYDFDYEFLDKETIGDKYRLEGFMFPDTYTFYVGDTPTRAISKLLNTFKAKFKEAYIERAAELGYSVRDIVTIASMIEKEAGDDSERAMISSVIYNRLNSRNLQYLQIDATIWYAIAGTDQAFSTDVDSPYNTYVVKGLPAGPIANPGINSLKAALYPESSNYYFYALNKEGTHNFFKDASAHEAFVQSDEYGG